MASTLFSLWNAARDSSWAIPLRLRNADPDETEMREAFLPGNGNRDVELGGLSTAQSSWYARTRPYLRRWRRMIIIVGTLAMLLFLAHLVNTRPAAPSRPILNGKPARRLTSATSPGCFVSVLEAYERDLARHRQTSWSSHTISPNDPAFRETFLLPDENALSDTGHVPLGDRGRHPIPQLLARGETQFVDLLSRQSRSLQEAREEYARRYGRKPPFGFDAWYRYATEKGTLLIDEYDQLESDLAPFRALGPKALREHDEAARSIPQLYTLSIVNGELSHSGGSAAPQWAINWRGGELENLIKPFVKWLPDMHVAMSSYDEPILYVPHSRLEELKKNPDAPLNSPDHDNGKVRLEDGCAPDTNAAQGITPREGIAFVYDAVAAGDMCQNPYLRHKHGMFIQPHNRDVQPRPYKELLPVFSFSPSSLNKDIRIPSIDQFDDDIGEDPAWEDKPYHRLAWRGSTTGMPTLNPTVDWRNSQRIRLHTFANTKSKDRESIIVPDAGPKGSTGDLGFTTERVRMDEAREHYLDMALAGKPIQCDASICDTIVEELHPAERQPKEELNKNKYIFDIDGNAWSGRFRRIMQTNSLIFKATIFPEWFQSTLVPWFMYVPTRMDFVDLTSLMAFFRGPLRNPEKGFDETAKAIAINGKCFVEKLFRAEDRGVYLFRMLLEYAEMLRTEEEQKQYEKEHAHDNDEPEPEPEPKPEPEPEPSKTPEAGKDHEASEDYDGESRYDTPPIDDE